MIVHHKILGKIYYINCQRLGLFTILDVKKHLCTLINGINIINIKCIKQCEELIDTMDVHYDEIDMIIVPIKCDIHC